MNILSNLLVLIDPLFEGHAYRNVVPDSAVAPYAKFSRVSGIEGVTLDENGGTDNEMATRIQIDIFGNSDDVDTKTAGVKAALKAWEVSNVVVLELDDYDAEVKLHRTILHVATIH